MPALGKVPILSQYIHNLRGCSRPVLARASDGEVYVVKFANAELGPNLLFNEAMGTELYRLFKLPVPAWKPLLFTEGFAAQMTENTVQPATGLCFGSQYLGREECRLLEVLPGSSFGRIKNLKDFWTAWFVDICAGHVDNRQVIFREDIIGHLDAVFIDHGHMFGGPRGELRKGFQAARYLDGRVYPHLSSVLTEKLRKAAARIDSDRVWLRLRALPDDWKTSSALSRLEDCLNTLSDANLLRNMLDAMLDCQSRANGSRFDDDQGGRKPVRSLLCPGIQGSLARQGALVA